MARFAKIDRRMFGDEKYRRLTAPPPGGQALWWHLLAGKQTGIVPGVYSIGEAAFAEQLGWTLKGFREAFGEVSREGMVKADWTAPLILIPNAIRYNEPASPNVIRSWSAAWDELPECELKLEAWQRLKTHVEDMGKGFREAFGEALPQGYGESRALAGALAGARENAGSPEPAKPPASGPPVLSFPTVGTGAKEWHLTEPKLAEYVEAFPSLDVSAECRKALQWIRDDPGRRKTPKGMPKFLGGWLGRTKPSTNGHAGAEDTPESVVARRRAEEAARGE